MLLKRRKHNSRRAYKAREYPSHRAWVRGFPCIVPGCEVNKDDALSYIEAAHCRRNTDGGEGLKPHDKWCFPACKRHHAEQHRGDLTFEAKYGVDCRAMALELAAKSPHRFKWLEAEND
jgi:hypothetical protein